MSRPALWASAIRLVGAILFTSASEPVYGVPSVYIVVFDRLDNRIFKRMISCTATIGFCLGIVPVRVFCFRINSNCSARCGAFGFG